MTKFILNEIVEPFTFREIVDAKRIAIFYMLQALIFPSGASYDFV